MLFVANVFQPFKQKRQRCFLAHRLTGAVFQVIDVTPELVQASHGTAVHGAGQAACKQGLEQADFVFSCKGAQLPQGLVPNAAFGAGDGPQKRRVVVVVDPQAEPSAQVLDLGFVKKALATRDFVRNIGAAQRLFKRPGHVVGAVQDGKVLKFTVFGLQRMPTANGLDAGYSAVGFVLFIHSHHHTHRFSLAQLGKQGFGEQLGVGRDHVVGGPQDGAGRAVVLLQLDHFQLGKILGQALQVVQRCAPPAINGLVVVAHRREPGALAHQVFQHLVLGGIGVLVFVYQHMAHLGLPALAHLWVMGQQLQRHADQVVKIHALVSA